MSKSSRSAISSLVSAAGPELPDLQDGRMTDYSGRAPVPASRSRSQANAKVPRTSGTFGPTSFTSSVPAGPLSSWENRLRERLGMVGSMEYDLVWKTKTTPVGRSISRLAPSTRRTEETGFTGWPTPNAIPEGRGGLQTNPEKAMERRTQGHQLNLDDAAVLAGWCSPSGRDWKDTEGMKQEGVNPDGSMRGRVDQLPRQVQLIGWNSPRSTDGSNGGPNQAGGSLSYDAAITITAGWSSPRANKRGFPDSHGRREDPLQTSGLISPLSTALTPKRGALNPEHPRWLMGFPPEWASCAPMVMPLSRNSRRKS